MNSFCCLVSSVIELVINASLIPTFRVHISGAGVKVRCRLWWACQNVKHKIDWQTFTFCGLLWTAILVGFTWQQIFSPRSVAGLAASCSWWQLSGLLLVLLLFLVLGWLAGQSEAQMQGRRKTQTVLRSCIWASSLWSLAVSLVVINEADKQHAQPQKRGSGLGGSCLCERSFVVLADSTSSALGLFSTMINCLLRLPRPRRPCLGGLVHLNWVHFTFYAVIRCVFSSYLYWWVPGGL